MPKKKLTLTPKTLRNELWETLQDVRARRIKPNESNAIASQAREICRLSKLELEFFKYSNKKPGKIVKFLTD